MIHLSTEDFSISPISSLWSIPANMPASPAGDPRSEAGQGRPFLGTWLTGNSKPPELKVRQPWTYKSSRADHFLRCGSRSARKGQVRHRTRGIPLGPALSAGPKNQLLQFEQVGFSPSPEAGSTSQPHPVVLLAAVHFSGGRNSLVNFDGVRQVVQGASRNKAQCCPTAHAEFTTQPPHEFLARGDATGGNSLRSQRVGKEILVRHGGKVIHRRLRGASLGSPRRRLNSFETHTS